MKEFDHALEDLTAATEVGGDAAVLSGSVSMAHAGRAEAFLSAGQYDEAIQDMTAALAAHPDPETLKKRLASALILRSRRYDKARNFRDAYSDWARAKELDPTVPDFSTYP